MVAYEFLIIKPSDNGVKYSRGELVSVQKQVKVKVDHNYGNSSAWAGQVRRGNAFDLRNEFGRKNTNF